MDVRDLVERAGVEVDELGPEPAGDVVALADWREERRGAAVLLAGLADWDTGRLRQAAMLAGPAATALLRDAVTECEAEAVGQPGPIPTTTERPADGP